MEGTEYTDGLKRVVSKQLFLVDDSYDLGTISYKARKQLVQINRASLVPSRYLEDILKDHAIHLPLILVMTS